MALIPMSRDGVLNNGGESYTSSSAGVVSPKISNADISIDDYYLVGAKTAQSGIFAMPYINNSGVWRIMLLNVSTFAPVTSATHTVTFYYKKN